MDAQELLTDLGRAGVQVAREGERLVMSGPARYLTPAIRMEIRRLKTQLLALLPDKGPQDAPGANERAKTPTPVPISIPEASYGPEDVQGETSLTPASWDGGQIRIEDLPAFKEQWGLVTVGSEWPEGALCPIVYLKSTRR